MRIRAFLGVLVLVAVVALVTTEVVSQDPGQDEALMMEKWTEFMTPGPAHDHFKARVGKWDAQVSMFMVPGAPPVTSPAVAVIESAMGGRYLIERDTGDFMGMPFEGMSITGYDNIKKRYVSSWVDNMGTGITSMEGIRKGNSIHSWGTGPNVLEDRYVPMRSVETTIDKDHHTVEMFGPGPDGSEYMAMRLVYTRQGAKNSQ